MKKTIIFFFGIGWLIPYLAVAQDWMQWKADSTRIQIVKTRDGSRIRARILEIQPDRVTVKIYSETLSLPTDSILSIKLEEQAAPEQEGRTKLLLSSTGVSLGFYGWSIPTALRIENSRMFVATSMFIGAGGFFIPYYLTRNTEVSDAASTGYLYGSTRGIAHGYGLYALAAGDEHWDYRNALTAMTVASLGEGIGFYYLADKLNYDGGRAEVVGVLGDFGLLNLGVFLPNILGVKDNRIGGASLLIGSGAGLVAGHYLTGKVPYTRGDAFALSDAGVLGGYTGLTYATLMDLENEKTIQFCLMTGSLTGLAIGERLMRDQNLTTGQGWMIRLSALGGALIGSGAAYLISKDPDAKLYASLSCSGALLGYGLMYYTVRLPENSLFRKTPSHNLFGNSSFSFYFNPASLWINKSGRSHTFAPLALLQMSFE